MANTILTATAITRESLRILHQKCNFIGSINRQYDSSFAKSGAKIGDTLKIRLPNEYVVRTGRTLQAQDTTETNIELKVQTQKGVDLNFNSADLTLSLDDFSERVLEPAMNVLAANIEADALSMRKDIAAQVDNSSAAVTFAKVLAGRKRMEDALVPAGNRTALLNTTDNANLVDALKGLFHDDKGLSKQYREGMMGRTAGFDFGENTHLNTQEVGTRNTAYLTDIASGEPAGTAGIINIDTGTGTIKQGEVFTIDAVFDVHPETKTSTGVLKKFVVTAEASGGANTLLEFSPPIVTSGARQNVSAAPADGAAVLFDGSASTNYGQSLLYHKDAFAFATADLVMPKGVDFAAREVYDGISMRVVRAYDINGDNFPCRLDILYGYKTLRQQLACRLANSATA